MTNKYSEPLRPKPYEWDGKNGTDQKGYQDISYLSMPSLKEHLEPRSSQLTPETLEIASQYMKKHNIPGEPCQELTYADEVRERKQKALTENLTED